MKELVKLYKGENVRHSHVVKTLKKDILLGIFFHFELVRLIFVILRLFHYVKLHLLSVKPTSIWLSLHIKLFDILQVLQTFHYKGKIKRDTFTLFF